MKIFKNPLPFNTTNLLRLGLGVSFVILTLTISPLRANTCLEAVKMAEEQAGFPDRLIEAVSYTESGRTNPETRKFEAWPWTVTVAGNGQYFPDQASAIEAVRQASMKGIENIDIGCMQINLRYHKAAFQTIEEMFDPINNTAYAASFLRQLYQRHGDWGTAISYYHSSDDVRGQNYQAKVLSQWRKLRPDLPDDPPVEMANTKEDIVEKVQEKPQQLALTVPTLPVKPNYTNAYVNQQLMELRARKQALKPQ